MNRRNFFRNFGLSMGAMIFTPHLIKPSWHDTLHYAHPIRNASEAHKMGMIPFVWDSQSFEFKVCYDGVPEPIASKLKTFMIGRRFHSLHELPDVLIMGKECQAHYMDDELSKPKLQICYNDERLFVPRTIVNRNAINS